MGPNCTRPSLSWCDKWVKSKDDLKKVYPKNVEYDRALATTKENFVDWFGRIHQEINPDNINVHLISNMDETMINSSVERLKVVVPRDITPTKAGPSDKADMHITAVLCIFADGDHTKPTLIFPLKEFPNDCLSNLEFFNFSGQESGWITSELFLQWTEKVYIPHVKEVRRKYNIPEHSWGVLYLDSHDSRRSKRALELLKENHVHVVTIVAHASHVQQPLDVGVNGAFKMNLKKFKPKMKGLSMELRRPLLLEAVQHALYNAFYPGSVRAAFKRAGLHPFDVTVVLSNPYTNSAQDIEILNIPTQKKRSGLKMDGRVITNDNFLVELGEQKEKAAAKRMATAEAKKALKRKATDKDISKTKSKKQKKGDFIINLASEDFDDGVG